MTVPLSGLITISRDGTNVVLPVNPPNFGISRERDYRDVPIVSYRDVGRFGNRKLTNISIESFFPARYDSAYCNYGPTGLLQPRQYEQILTSWCVEDPPKPVFVRVSGRLVDSWFAITKFDVEDRAGEPGDVYYALTMREFVHTNASVFNFGPPPRPPSASAPVAGTQYTIVSGDTLWGIAKRYYGNGSLWPDIWAVNKPMRSGNPNLIFPGEVIYIPSR